MSEQKKSSTNELENLMMLAYQDLLQIGFENTYQLILFCDGITQFLEIMLSAIDKKSHFKSTDDMHTVLAAIMKTIAINGKLSEQETKHLGQMYWSVMEKVESRIIQAHKLATNQMLRSIVKKELTEFFETAKSLMQVVSCWLSDKHNLAFYNEFIGKESIFDLGAQNYVVQDVFNFIQSFPKQEKKF